jgi:nanoRNase/pAp phosphatase (c-di-AMP/oligoRNAs hydrolase)
MSLAGKLPAMEDAALATLRTNAERLLTNGTSAQQTAAAALLPSIKAELAARVAAKMNKTKPAEKAGRRASKPKAAIVAG